MNPLPTHGRYQLVIEALSTLPEDASAPLIDVETIELPIPPAWGPWAVYFPHFIHMRLEPGYDPNESQPEGSIILEGEKNLRDTIRQILQDDAPQGQSGAKRCWFITAIGHADKTKEGRLGDQFNEFISKWRAERVVSMIKKLICEYAAKDAGVNKRGWPKDFAPSVVTGMGNRDPVRDVLTKQDDPRNRRVEFRLELLDESIPGAKKCARIESK